MPEYESDVSPSMILRNQMRNETRPVVSGLNAEATIKIEEKTPYGKI